MCAFKGITFQKLRVAITLDYTGDLKLQEADDWLPSEIDEP